VSTPPRITAVERDAAIARIDRRHARIDDPRRSELGFEPREVIAFILDRGPAGVPRWVSAADHLDAVVLSTWCWWEDRRTERRLLRQALHLGTSLAELGAPLGIRTRQGMRDRLDRLEALLTYDRPDEQLTRIARRDVAHRDGRQDWIDAHHEEIRAALLALQAQTIRVLSESSSDGDPDQEEARGWLDELNADYRDDAVTPATLAVAGLAVGELRGLLAVQALDQRHPLLAVLREIDQLRARIAPV
jgi:hypothetical protein